MKLNKFIVVVNGMLSLILSSVSASEIKPEYMTPGMKALLAENSDVSFKIPTLQRNIENSDKTHNFLNHQEFVYTKNSVVYAPFDFKEGKFAKQMNNLSIEKRED